MLSVAAADAAPRFMLTDFIGDTLISRIGDDVRHGLLRTPKTLPPKYFYDAHGAQVFDAICDTDEYYPTRTELALLEACAGKVIDCTAPTAVVELGSGAARKTRLLLDAHVASSPAPVYFPVDISRKMLVESSAGLLAEYPSLTVHGVVADYDRHLHLLPAHSRRLIAFLGSTIGNFTQHEGVEFLASVAAGMTPADHLLLGVDLVKSPGVLREAYNDGDGLTAEFNRNVLRVLNRELEADFEPAAFEHIARYLPEQEQIEMYLRARSAQSVRLEALDLDIQFARGERIRTEISRKFRRAGVEAMFAGAGLELIDWLPSADGYFALALGSVRRLGALG